MSSAVSELEAGLQAMQGLKPPGVSGSRITALTALCVANVQSESVLIQKLYTHFKKAPGTHKLGVLYVVDSVTRKWLDQARLNGQTVSAAAPDGTYAAGVNRVTELIPVLMNDILASAPADQKDKIKKLVDIWEKGQTFPPKLIESFKEKLSAAQPNESTTPPGSPPANGLNRMGAAARPGGAPPPAPPPAGIPPSIMETLANLAKQSSAAASAPPQPATATPPTLSGPFGGAPRMPPQQQPPMPSYSAQAPVPAPVNAQQPLPFQIPATAAAAMPPFGAAAGAPPAASNLALPPGFPGVLPQQPQQQPPQQPPANIQQNLMLIQALLAQGLSLDQISGILQMTTGANGAAAAALPGGGAQQPASLVPAAIAAAAAAAAAGGGGGGAAPPYGGVGGSRMDRYPSSRDDGGYGGRSPRGGSGRGRSRSRSPRYWETDNGGGGGRGGGDRGGRGGRDRDRDRDYRQRSPPGGSKRGGSGSGNGNGNGEPAPPSAAEKWVEHDASLPPGTIRVLSRTLFVGGVTISEPELRAIFSRFGGVQTCIVNKEKRHAFVKMYTRRDAEAAKAGMETNGGGGSRGEDSGLRTRWGVGFGPRDCSDYSQGVSVIPIGKLTEADRKWLLTAAWGGSGGRPITTGLVVEEPDIEIGAGVSSKAISRRMQTDRGGINGPRSTRREEELAHGGGGGPPGGGGGGGGRGRRGGGGGGGRDRRGDELNYGESDNGHGRGGGGGGGSDGSAAFPFGLALGNNGMPVFPPGFAFPAPDQS